MTALKRESTSHHISAYLWYLHGTTICFVLSVASKPKKYFSTVRVVQEVSVFSIKFQQRRFKMALIKSMRWNEIKKWHHSFHNIFRLWKFSHSECIWMVQWSSMQNSGFCLSSLRLILPIKPVYFPLILGALPAIAPLILSMEAQVTSCFFCHQKSFRYASNDD
jgi:hypothetical protein